MPKKKKKILIILIVILLIIFFAIGGICIYLYLTTDTFKSNRTLFEKYIAQNFNVLQNFTQSKSDNIENFLNNNKYTSNFSANVNYTSSDSNTEENTNENGEATTGNNINNLELNINSQVDKANQYDYKDIRLAYETENVARAEYIQDNNLLGIRLNGIKQFVTIDTQDLESLSEKMNISKDNLNQLCLLSNQINISELINFTEEEKETLAETYTSILEQNTQNENFKRVKNQTIEVNDSQMVANGYYIETTKEQYNNLLIAILEQITKDEIILGKIDNIQNELVEYGIVKENQDTNLREQFIEYINDKIDDIKNTNIGNETYRITVYENNGQTIKTEIETEATTIEMNLYNNGTSVDIQDTTMENEDETTNLIKLENTSQENTQNIIIQYEEIKNNVIQKNIQIETQKELKNNQIDENIDITYEINKNKIEIKATNYMKSVNEFEDQVELDEENNITLNDWEEEQITNITNALTENINNQINNITSKVTPEELNSMLKELGFIKEDIFETEEPVQVTEIERNRFNSQLTFFIGEKQSADNINLLLNAISQHLEDVNIENTTNERGEEKLNQITLEIKRNTTNDEKLQEARNAITENNREQFDVTMSYDEETQLINRIFIKVHQED